MKREDQYEENYQSYHGGRHSLSQVAATLMRMERQKAREIACVALNPHIDTVLNPTPEDEGFEIDGTLKQIEKTNPEEINDINRVIVKESNSAGYDTSIDPTAVLRCKTVGDLVDEIRNSSSKN
jgi:hypothetical protein